jgi:MtN3 and saliva related transmembrane protein
MKNLEMIIGLLASTTASLIFFPQVIASYKSKKTKDLSWSGIYIGLLNGCFWIMYGLMKADPFIYITNSILFIGAFLLLILKRKYG